MPANHLDGRYGLASYADTNTYLHKDDVNQMVLRALAVGDVFASLMGGEGIYSGGALVIGSIASGTTYPAFMGMMKDDGDAWWFFHPAAGTLMDFLVSSGACTAYLVPTSVDGVTPSMAVGGLADFMILVQLTATAAPANSIPLGSGNVTASAFTNWTVDPAVMVAANASLYARRTLAETISGNWLHSGTTRFTGAVDIEGALTLLDGGSDHDLTLLRANLAAARSYTFPDAGGAAEFVMNLGTQVIGGLKTFSSLVTAAQNDATLTLSVAQTIANNTITIVNWDGVVLVGFTNSSGTLTVPAGGGGTYLFSGILSFAANATGTRIGYIYKSTAAQFQMQEPNRGASDTTPIAFTFPLTLAAGDTVSIRMYQNSGGNLDTRTGAEIKFRIRQMV